MGAAAGPQGAPVQQGVAMAPHGRTLVPERDTPVVEGVLVGTPMVELQPAGGQPPLKDMVDKLRRELSLERLGNNMNEVVNEACAQLGVDASGSLLVKAQRCYERLLRS